MGNWKIKGRVLPRQQWVLQPSSPSISPPPNQPGSPTGEVKSLSCPPCGHINAKYPFPGLKMILNDTTPDSETPHPLLSHPSPSCRMSGTFQSWEVLQPVLLQETGEQLLLLLLPQGFGGSSLLVIPGELLGLFPFSWNCILSQICRATALPKALLRPRAVPALSALALALCKCCSMSQLLAQLLPWDRCSELTQHRKIPTNTALSPGKGAGGFSCTERLDVPWGDGFSAPSPAWVGRDL